MGSRNLPGGTPTLADVTDETTTTPLTPIDGGNVPVFGKRTTPFEERSYRQFGLEVETTKERWVETFDAYFDVDGGGVLALMNSRNQMAQANATAVLLGTSLRDDDGVPLDWQPPAQPELEDPDDPESDWLRQELPDDAPEDAEGEPLYALWDDSLVTSAELADWQRSFDPLDEGSSRRRFQFLMDSPDHRVQFEALTQIAEWVMGDLVKRPTQQPARSGRGRQRTSRGSAAKRH